MLAHISHKPKFVELTTKAKRTASQRNVARVSPCVAMSLAVSTPVISNRPRPVNATLVTLRFSLSAKIQPVTISTNAMAVIHSSRDSGPSSASDFRAAAGASGVAPTPGGNKRASNQGSARIETSAGTDEAIAIFQNRRSRRIGAPPELQSDSQMWPSSKVRRRQQGRPWCRTSDNRPAGIPWDRPDWSPILWPPKAQWEIALRHVQCCWGRLAQLLRQ